MNRGVARRSSTATHIVGFSGGFVENTTQEGPLGRPGIVVAKGGTISYLNGNRYHTFSSSGNFTVSRGGKIQVLVVSGGGGGGSASWDGIPGGGGGGGAKVFDLDVLPKEVISVVVGGGAGSQGYLGTNPALGSSSSITGSFGTYSIVGGASGRSTWAVSPGSPIGGANQGACGAGLGAMGTYTHTCCGGGGGMGGLGNNGSGTPSGLPGETVRFGFRGGACGNTGSGGAGGIGLLVWGNYYCGGGGGGSQNQSVAALGGLGGGGSSGTGTSRGGSSGTANTGGGGGAANSVSPWPGTQSTAYGGNGGSGIVIFRYAANNDLGSSGLQGARYNGYFADNVNWFNTATLTSGPTLFQSITSGQIGTGDGFSWQWTGYFEPDTSGTWTFYTSSDDASYLWVGSVAQSGWSTANALVNNAGLHGAQERSGSISLTGGQRYPIRIQFGESTGGENMDVSIQGPNLAKTTSIQNYCTSNLNGTAPNFGF